MKLALDLCVVVCLCSTSLLVILWYFPWAKIMYDVVGGHITCCFILNEPRHEKTGLRGFPPGLTQTRLYNTEDG